MKYYNCINDFSTELYPYDRSKKILKYDFVKNKSYKFKVLSREVICMEDDANKIRIHISSFNENFSLKLHRDKIIDTIN